MIRAKTVWLKRQMIECKQLFARIINLHTVTTINLQTWQLQWSTSQLVLLTRREKLSYFERSTFLHTVLNRIKSMMAQLFTSKQSERGSR